MIHLDTNLLIRAAGGHLFALQMMRRWREAGEAVGTSSVAWFEFACGPVDADRKRMIWRLICDHFTGFGAREAERAATLFNRTGRERAQRWDCMIAATAIESEAHLATLDSADFRPFVSAGLALAKVEA